MRTNYLRRSVLGIALGAFVFTACTVGEENYVDVIGDRGDIESVTRQGSNDSLDIATWNVEWFGSTSKGPDDEGLQLDNVRDVILGTDLDIWGLQEVTDSVAFSILLENLPGYDGILASDATVEQGSSYYHNSEQKVAVVYKSSVAEVVRARVILTEWDYEFAGRPPLELTMDVTVAGETQELTFIVLHAKAMTDSTSYSRRQRGAQALHDYLDQNHPSSQVIVVGDYNDDLDDSIRRGMESPYQGLLDDASAYTFPTLALSEAGISSTARYSDTIDHHLVTDELMARFIADSVEALRDLAFEIDDYVDTTSDHFPVMSRYTWGGGQPTGEARVFINEILANEPGSDIAAEFIEIVNTGDAAADLTGWFITDNTGERHAFADGATIAPQSAYVVFGGEAGIPAGLSQTAAASSGGLGLNNSGDVVTLVDASGADVDQVSYDAALAEDGVSMNRSSDADPGASFALHDSLAPAKTSPGTRMDGTPFAQ